MSENIIAKIKNYFNKSIDNDTEDETRYDKIEDEDLNDIPKTICNFCTIGSGKYLTKLIALYNSLRKSNCRFQLWVLSMDKFSDKVLNDLKLENLNIIFIETLEEDIEILKAKDGKKENEYCWMLKAPLIEYVMQHEDIESMIYVDSDIFFLNDPAQIFDCFQYYSVYLSPQRDMDYIEMKYGKYQAGLIGFKKDREGMEALSFWKAKCLEWCRGEYDAVGQRFGDQKYLDEIPWRFQAVKVEENYGVNAAPWNCIYNNERTIAIEDDIPCVNGDKIILFHFACITMFNQSEFDLWNMDRLEIPKYILSKLYIPYLEALAEAAQSILSVAYGNEEKIFSDKSPDEAKSYFSYDQFSVKIMEHGDIYHLCSIVSNDYLIRVIALYNSLMQYQNNFNLWLCVIDQEAYDTLSSLELENVTLIDVGDIDADVRAKHDKNEYCWILKSLFVDYLFINCKLDKILYCDADTYFYSTVKHIYEEWGAYSFFMTTQRADKYMEQVDGQYQAGLLGFKNDNYGEEILSWWKQKCLDWCYDWHDKKHERWGDQKYLDKIPLLFENIKISHNLGINAAPWNLILNDLSYYVTGDDNQVFINNYSICSYHFGSMRVIEMNKFDLWYRCELTIKPEIMNLIYLPYIKELNKVMEVLIQKGFNLEAFICTDCEISAKNPYILEEAVNE